MSRDWLLVETMGPQLVVAAQGHQLRKLIPIQTFLQRNRYGGEIAEAVLATRRSARAARQRSEHGNRVIHTEPVTMTDGHVHGVQVWAGPPGADEPARPVIGSVVWDLTTGIASDTPEALANSGFDPAAEVPDGRTLAEDLKVGFVHPDETKLLSLTANCQPGETLCSTWEVKAHSGETIRVNFTARAALEPSSDGSLHLIGRGMNWRSPYHSSTDRQPHLAEQILRGTAQDGIHRAIVDLKNCNVLKWLDPPCSHFDWRGEEIGRPLAHPDDQAQLHSLLRECTKGKATTGVLRLRSKTGWTLLSLTIHRIELAESSFVGLVQMRLPTPADLVSLSSRGATPLRG